MSFNITNFPKIKSLPPYHLGEVAKKIHELRISGVDVIDLSQLNPSMHPSQVALDSLVQASLKPHNHRYSASSGIYSLRESLCNYYNWKFNVEIDPNSEIAITNGTKEGIVHLLMSILSPGDSMLVPVPSYPVHTAAAALVGVNFIGVPLWRDYHSFKEDGGVLTSKSNYFFERLGNRFFQTWPRPKVILISFPHNPTTTIVSHCFYERLISFAERNSCLIVNDFAHGDLYYNSEDNISILSLPSAKKHCVELYSISKGFSLAGWRVGSASGNYEAIQALKSLKSYTDFGIFQPIQIAASKLLNHEISTAGEIVYENLQAYKSRRDLVISQLLEKGWDVNVTKASPFVWAAIPNNAEGLDSKSYCEEVLEKSHVAFFPGSAFDSQQKKTVRISLTENETRLRQAMSRLSKFIFFFVLFFKTVTYADDNCPKALTLVKKAHVPAFSGEEIKQGLLEATKLCPQLVEALYELGRLYLKDEKFELAEQKFKEAESIKPKVEHVIGLALSQALKKDYVSSENTYKQGLTTYLGHWALLEGLAVLYMDLNKLEEAEELLRQALQVESSVDSVYYNLGLVLEKQSKIDEAIISYRTALDKNHAALLPAVNLSRLLYRAGNHDESLNVLKKALLHNPNSSYALLLHSNILLSLGRLSEAKKDLQKISDPKFSDRKTLLSLVINSKEGLCDNTLQDFEGLKIQKDSLEFKKALGSSLAICRNYEKAEKVLLEALSINSNDAYVLNNLGSVYESLGDIAKAKDFYSRAGSALSHSLILENLERIK